MNRCSSVQSRFSAAIAPAFFLCIGLFCQLQAADVAVTVNRSTKLQIMDGFGDSHEAEAVRDIAKARPVSFLGVDNCLIADIPYTIMNMGIHEANRSDFSSNLFIHHNDGTRLFEVKSDKHCSISIIRTDGKLVKTGAGQGHGPPSRWTKTNYREVFT